MEAGPGACRMSSLIWAAARSTVATRRAFSSRMAPLLPHIMRRQLLSISVITWVCCAGSHQSKICRAGIHIVPFNRVGQCDLTAATDFAPQLNKYYLEEP